VKYINIYLSLLLCLISCIIGISIGIHIESKLQERENVAMKRGYDTKKVHEFKNQNNIKGDE